MKFVGENEFCEFYINFMTESLTKDCVINRNKLPKLYYYKVFICKDKKSGEMSYVLFDDKGTPIKANTHPDTLAVEIERLKFLKAVEEDDNN